jgi:uncharacterized protein (DUF58 family)
MTVIPFARPAVLRRLSLVADRRLHGLLQGDHPSFLPGPGTEPAEARRYVVGDDVRRIDWAATARTGGTIVRDAIAERELHTKLVVDLSPSMAFGTVRCEKRDLAVAVATALGELARGPGDQVSTDLLTAAGPRHFPARHGRSASIALVRAAQSTPRQDGPSPDLGSLLTTLTRRPSRPGLLIVISDLIEPYTGDEPSWARPLRRLAHRHDVLVIEIIDPRELRLPAIGALRVVSPESGRQVEVHTTPTLRRRYAQAAADRRLRNAAAVRAAGAAHLVLRTDQDWLTALARHLTNQRRLRTARARTSRGTA